MLPNILLPRIVNEKLNILLIKLDSDRGKIKENLYQIRFPNILTTKLINVTLISKTLYRSKFHPLQYLLEIWYSSISKRTQVEAS